ncbi:MAG: hypothetical protein HQK56_18230 [Deltaproteobacteria bacterium]|nr:hypothetical protein [Deltaproteobacteria bacterium]
MREIVSDTGALITLEKMRDGYSFIQKLYSKIIVPPKVLEEVSFHYGSSQNYLKKYDIVHLIDVDGDFSIAKANGMEDLDGGESEAISLALKLNLDLLIEEDLGRQVAKRLGIKIAGIGGVVYKAWKMGIIAKKEALNKMQEIFDKKRLDLVTYQALIQKILSK